MIVSTVRVLLLTVWVEIISPSAVYPWLVSPRIICWSLSAGIWPTVVEIADDEGAADEVYSNKKMQFHYYSITIDGDVSFVFVDREL